MGPTALRLWGKAILCQIIIAIIWVPHCVPAEKNEEGDAVKQEGTDGGESPTHNNTCEDPVCRKMVRTIQRQMGNETPCDDFHNYVCGNWKGDKELKPSILKEKAVKQLAGLLKNSSEPTEYGSARDKLVRAYYSCWKKGKDERALLMSIKHVLDGYNVTNKTWPIIDNITQPTGNGSEDYVEVLRKMGPRPVFSFSVSVENGTPIIVMTKPIEFYVFETEDSASTISVVEEAAPNNTAGSDEDYNYLLEQDEKAYRKFIEKTIMLLNELFSKEEARNATEDIVEMERGLSRLAEAAKNKTPEKMNLSQLDQRLGNAFSMADVLQKDFEGLNITISEGTEVLVQYFDYFESAVNLMKCTPMETLINYALWTKIRKMAEAVGTRLNNIYERYRNSTPFLSFTPPETPPEDSEKQESARTPSNVSLSLKCVQQLLHTDVMYTAAANFYINATFNKTFQADVLKMMQFVKYSFIDVVQNNTWMSTKTRKEVFERLETMTTIIGYPDWMVNDTIINALYWPVPYVGKAASFVEHYHHLTENSFKQELLLLAPDRYINRTDEDIPLRSHAYYASRRNRMVYPAAALVTHYRSRPIPRSANFGTIGTILGHLFVKLIERYEYHSKKTGWYYKDTWDNKTREQFCNRSACLNNSVECNDTYVNRSHKLETLEDYLGLRISYQAMTNSTDNYTAPFLLPDERLDSESKIFFTFMGSLYCPYSVYRKRIQSRTDDGEKFPDKLDEIVYTYAQFNTTFNCTVFEDADSCYLTQGRDPPRPVGC